jgi:drug/metabolite transporter (DMT)-like permease
VSHRPEHRSPPAANPAAGPAALSRDAAAGRVRALGLVLLLATAVGWGFNWPVLKFLLGEWPPLFARGLAGVTAGVAIAAIAAARGERLAVPRALVPRLLASAFTNVFAWMGFTTVAMRWLDAGEGALLVYTMPIWTMLLAWPLQGRRPTRAGILALCLAFGGVAILLFPAPGAGMAALAPERIGFDGGRSIGVALMFAAAICFALGTVAWRTPLPLPPLVGVAWQVGLGCLPMLGLAFVFERDEIVPLSLGGWAAMAYMTVIPMGVCYLSWFAALRRVPATTASMATLLTPVIGVVSAAALLGEPFGLRQVLALALTLSGVALALRRA